MLGCAEMEVQCASTDGNSETNLYTKMFQGRR